MKYLKLLSILFLIGSFISCGEDDINITDPVVQRSIDIALINDYLDSNGFSDSKNDTTASGVRYIILDDGGRGQLSECDSTCIDESDNVSFRYVGMTLDGTIFDTNIDSVLDSLHQYYEENPYIINGDSINLFPERELFPIEATYTGSGWAMSGLVPGFVDGISATFNKLSVGGVARIIMPSDLGYGTVEQGVLIPENSVLVFDLFPERVEKQ